MRIRLRYVFSLTTMHFATINCNMHGQYIQRILHQRVLTDLAAFPVVAILGPRQCGKSTLAHRILKDATNPVYLDLERPSDLRKLTEPELFFRQHRNDTVCLDEIQRAPELFPVLRSEIDADRRPSRFLILGSASPELIKQSSETLAGRIGYLELTPLLFSEVIHSLPYDILSTYWLRGGFPESFLSRNDESAMRWLENFIRTFLERDISQFGVSIPSQTLRRVWQLCAHSSGQVFNASRLGTDIGVSHTTMKKYIDLLSHTFMLRVLPPFVSNRKKRLVKSPKIYLRDTGILHSLLRIERFDDLLGHPSMGPSWETLAVENIIAAAPDGNPIFTVRPMALKSTWSWCAGKKGSPWNSKPRRLPASAVVSGMQWMTLASSMPGSLRPFRIPIPLPGMSPWPLWIISGPDHPSGLYS